MKLSANTEECELNVDWTALPQEILILVMEKLCWSQRVPSSLVCKTWHECFLQIQNAQGFLPWVMCYDWDTSICKLGDPSAQTSYIVKEATRWENTDLCGTDPRASRHGWVLFSKVGGDFSSTPPSYNNFFFLYNPFTNEIIKLPALTMDFSRKATFSGHPGSPDCTVIAFWNTTWKLFINTCHPGDQSWSEYEFTGEFTYNSITEVAYAGDFVYIRFLDGHEEQKLGAFNIKQPEWKVLSYLIPDRSYFYKHLFVAFNGDLIVCCESHREGRRLFWRFDLSENKWVVVEDEIMKKQVIFIGCTSFSVPAVDNARESAGKVYYLRNSLCFSFNFVESEPEAGDFKWLIEDYRLDKIWIQPPFQTHR